MARGRRRRATNNRRRRRKNVRRMSSAPPRLSITANTRSIVISYAYDVVDSNVNRKDIKMSDIFTHPPNIGIPFQYREGKINSVKVYWQSDNSTADAGSVCLNVEDYGENLGTEACDFAELLSYPGSMVRKVWQNVSNRWFPTEPSDREFHDLTGSEGVLTVTVRHSISSSKLKGRIICTVNVRVRGKSTRRAKLASVILLKEDLDAITENMELVIGDTAKPSTS